jgi:hypothetical protein
MGAAGNLTPTVRLNALPPPAIAQRLQALLLGDGQEPGADGRLLPEPGHRGVGPEGNLLGYLLPGRGIAQHGGAVANDQVLVAQTSPSSAARYSPRTIRPCT